MEAEPSTLDLSDFSIEQLHNRSEALSRQMAQVTDEISSLSRQWSQLNADRTAVVNAWVEKKNELNPEL